MSISKREWEEWESSTHDRRGYPPLPPINARRPSPPENPLLTFALWALLLIAIVVMIL